MARRIDMIVVHCAATPPSADIGVAEIDKWHRDRGFRKVGYHYVIRRDGRIEKGRDHQEIGAHAEGFNARSIGVCLVGGVDAKGKPEANYTDIQMAVLEHTLRALKEQHPTITQIVGHRDLGANKACPCFDVKPWASERGL